MRVATFFQHQQALDSLQRTNQSLDKYSYQLTSGLKAQSYQDIAGDVNQLLNLKDLKNNNTTYMSNISTADSRLSAMDNALQGMSDLLTQAASVYTLSRNELSADTRATIAPQAEGLAETFYQLMNTQFEGNYIFSGQAGNTQPLSASLTANPYPGDPPPTTYYGGDSQRLQVITGPGTVQEYGVTGDDVGFARIKSGLEALVYGLQNDSDTDLDGAITLLQQAQKDVSNMLGSVGGSQSGLQLINDRHDNANAFMQTRIDDLEKADITVASTRFAQEQASLEASLSVTSKILQISLLKYL